MKIIKNSLVPILCLLAIGTVFMNADLISDYIAKTLERNPNVVIQEGNAYKKEDDFIYVQNTKNFVPLSYNDILNIYYTILNNGYENFTFYCPSEYKNCTKDVTEISNDPETLSYISNFVHPFNSFSDDINNPTTTEIYESGEINITIHYLYTEEEKQILNQKVDEILKKIITNKMSDQEKIKEIHDYIIEHTKYDTNNKYPVDNSKATGPLLYGYATCSGYTDAMALFLEKLGIKNFKVATKFISEDTEGHIWNAVFLNGKWLHLDLTWDDPVDTSKSEDNRKDYLEDTYFLISTENLEKIDAGNVVIKDHLFSKRIYPELKK